MGKRNFLNAFYKGETGAAFMMQMSAMISNFENMRLASKIGGKVLVERGVHSSIKVFTEVVF